MWRIAGKTGAVGFEVFLSVVIGYFGGKWLDDRFHTGPWLTYLGFASGVGAAIKALVRISRQYRRQTAAEDEAPDKPDAQH